ncbi:MAG: FlgD immunoglobulin-like domain containing protein [Candidatus Eisenbacteria bacterium]|nr:FlgD immunoglobulin-like domain containing protein [Candidatus Eisenbacteria bacterium]
MRSAFLPLSAILAALASYATPASPQGIVSGSVGGDEFGAGVRGVGDLNNDGFEDFAVGAPGQDALGSEAGRVYLFFGQAKNFKDTPDIILGAGNGGDHFGAAVAGIGRFNNDAYDDLAVGAPDSDADGSGRGRVYLYFGGPSTTSLTTGPILSGQQGGDHFGYALDGGFDFNNDGQMDLAVGSPDNPAVGLQGGQVRIYFGATPVTAAGDVVLTGDQAQDWFGAAVRRGGDVNNDGFGDLIVGAPQPFAANAGRAYVILGRGDGAAPSRLTLNGEFGGDRFGAAVAGGGDLDNDGFDDVAVGAPKQDASQTQNGAIYVFRGGSPMNTQFDAIVGGRESGDEMGTSVSIGGDWNLDGRSDLLGGAPLSDDGGNQAGEINLWLGANPIDTGSRAVYLGPRLLPGFAAADEFGTAVDFTDYNGDGHADVLGGAPRANQISGDETGFVSLQFFPGTLVPVRLLGVTLIPAGDRVELSWAVEDDGSILGFHVERRSPGTAWSRRTASILFASSGVYRFVDIDQDLAVSGIREYRLAAISRNGLEDTFGPWSVVVGSGVRPLLGNGFPNPSVAGITVPVVLPEGAFVTVTIVDAAGRLVRRLHDGPLPVGRTNLWWDGTGDDGARRTAGSYWYHLATDRTVEKRKVIILR